MFKKPRRGEVKRGKRGFRQTNLLTLIWENKSTSLLAHIYFKWVSHVKNLILFNHIELLDVLNAFFFLTDSNYIIHCKDIHFNFLISGQPGAAFNLRWWHFFFRWISLKNLWRSRILTAI